MDKSRDFVLTMRTQRSFGIIVLAALWDVFTLLFLSAGEFMLGMSGLLAVALWLTALALWNTVGWERVSVVGGTLVVEYLLFRAPVHCRLFDVARIQKFRFDPVPRQDLVDLAKYPSPARRLGFGVGPIAFTYEGRTVRIGEVLRHRDRMDDAPVYFEGLRMALERAGMVEAAGISPDVSAPGTASNT